MMIIASTRPLLVFVVLLAMAIWVGGFVAIAVVASVARGELGPSTRVRFFRALGRRYGVVGGPRLVVALTAGGVLLADRSWDGAALAAVVLGAALLLTTAAGVMQARGMTRLRTRALNEVDRDEVAEQVQRGARRAAALRTAIGALTLALLAVVAILA